MRIGLVSYEYPPQQGMGGVGTYMFRLAGALGRVGHEVHVITGPSDRAPVQQANVTLHRIAARIHRWPIVIRMHCPWELFVRINRVPFNPMDRLLSMLERRVVANYADCLTVPSEAMKREVEKSWKLRRPPVVIPNFMDVPS